MLRLTGDGLIERLDFGRMTRVRTTFVGRDYRHVEADVVLTAPLLGRRGSGPGRRVWIYVLLEHQSEPDLLMELRVLEYLIHILKAQVREHYAKHKSYVGLRLRPVLPVVFYTGTHPWENLGRLLHLVEGGEEFRRFLPHVEPLFINLKDLPKELLVSAGGAFGQVLRLWQGRSARAADYRRLLEEVIGHLESLPPEETPRRHELLSYVHALVYHQRKAREHARLRESIETSVRYHEDRREVGVMSETIAEMLMRKGQEKGRRQGRKEGREEGRVEQARGSLLLVLTTRFGEVPSAVAQTVEETESLERLASWMRRALTAEMLADVGIGQGK